MTLIELVDKYPFASFLLLCVALGWGGLVVDSVVASACKAAMVLFRGWPVQEEEEE